MDNVVGNVHSLPQGQSAESELPLSPNAISALSYFCGIIAIVALMMKDYQKNAFVRFHATQALVFQGAWVLGYMALAILTAVYSTMIHLIIGSLKLYTLLGLLIAVPTTVYMLFTVGMFATWIVLILGASQGKTVKLPVFGKIAARMTKS